MKKSMLILIIFSFFYLPLKSMDMSFGFYWETGKTIVDKWDVVPPGTVTITNWDSNYSGFYLQALIELKKIWIGLEFGDTHFLSYNYEIPNRHGWNDNYEIVDKQKRIFAIVQFDFTKDFFAQLGTGIYFEKPKPGFMFSLGKFISISKNIKIPIFSRMEIVTKKGTPIIISLGAGVVISWMSGL